LTVAPGTYVLHYLVDGHEVGSGTFTIKGTDGATPVPAATQPPMITPTPTPTPTPTQAPATKQPKSQPQSNCIGAYPDFCIKVGTPDLDCGDIPWTDFTVLAPDPMRFDGDHDGIGCES